MEALIEISLILTNKQATDEDHIQEFVELFEQGWRAPLITVRRTGAVYRIVDGRHRLAAHKRLGRTHVRAWVTL